MKGELYYWNYVTCSWMSYINASETPHHYIRLRSAIVHSTTSLLKKLNMKLVILFALFAVAVAQQATLKSSEARMNPDGSYKYSFELDDGTRVVESGEQKQITVQDAGTVSRGQYTFVADGQRFTVDWVADENGFVATGDHLPRAP